MWLSKHDLWMFAGRAKLLLPMIGIYSKSLKKDIHITNQDTDIVIEGYPRCANTRVVAAFRLAQPDSNLNIAHHVHGPAQILKGIKLNKPVLLVTRNPLDAVVSLCIRDESISPGQAFSNYVKFHLPLLPIINDIVISDFDDSTSNLDSVIIKLNNKYSTSYQTLQQSGITEEMVATEVREMDKRDTGGSSVSESKAGVPSDTRKQLALELKSRIQNDSSLTSLLNQADSIYRQIVSSK